MGEGREAAGLLSFPPYSVGEGAGGWGAQRLRSGWRRVAGVRESGVGLQWGEGDYAPRPVLFRLRAQVKTLLVEIVIAGIGFDQSGPINNPVFIAVFVYEFLDQPIGHSIRSAFELVIVFSGLEANRLNDFLVQIPIPRNESPKVLSNQFQVSERGIATRL